MKFAIVESRDDLEALIVADCTERGYPRPGYYADGSPAPDGWGVTVREYDALERPDAKAWAYPVPDSAKPTTGPSGASIGAGEKPPPKDATAVACVAVLAVEWAGAVSLIVARECERDPIRDAKEAAEKEAAELAAKDQDDETPLPEPLPGDKSPLESPVDPKDLPPETRRSGS